MAKNTGATKLMALDAIALDLETTSLNVKEGRIVQVGAIRLNRGHLEENSHIDKLINPQIEIPQSSSEIHGITNKQVAKCPDLPKAWPDLMAYYGGRVLIGHTIGYDLTILANEAARHDLPWQKPRSLCVRLLAPIALPDLHDPSLDKLASWFDIEIKHRHSALSDAHAAAAIFVKLIPLLEEKGIHTLAEAERAILRRSAAGVREGENAGWERPVVDPSETALSGGIKSYDTYAYRHNISDLMAKIPLIISPETSLREAARIMSDKAISSVLVAEAAKAGQLIDAYSIITERDLMRQIASYGAAALKKKAGDIAIGPVKSIRENAFIYRAMSRMRRLKIRHLAVVDDGAHLVGMVSARDLLKQRSDAAIELDDAIGEANNAADLANAWGSLPSVVNSLIDEDLEAHKITRIVSEEIKSMTERAAVLAERSMKKEGLGEPPCPYAVIVLGSGGRGESLLKPDQDNAIVFAEGQPDGPEDKWFAEQGRRIADLLYQSGIPYCDGGIMAKNSEWRGSVELWQERLTNWVGHTNPKNLLNVDIFFDQSPVHGHRRLSLDLFHKAFEMGSHNVGFAKALGANVENISNPFTLFGRIKAENNQLDLKLHGLFPLVSGVRALAIRHNIAKHATRDRLLGLTELDRGDIGLIKKLLHDHGFLLSLLLRSQQYEVASGRKATNFIDLGKLDREQSERLKKALSNIQYIPELVRDLMF